MGYFDRWICADCGLELFDTSYMIHDALWLTVMETKAGHLCPLCFEERLGRRLVPGDFTRCPINDEIALRVAGMRAAGRERLRAWADAERARLDKRSAQARARRARRRAAAQALGHEAGQKEHRSPS